MKSFSPNPVHWFRLPALAIAVVLVVVGIPTTYAQTFNVLYTFGSTPDGGTPVSSLIGDLQGNFYGTASADGAFGFGTVYRLTPTGKEIMYSFAGAPDGAAPHTPLLLDSTGTFWGTTFGGGNAGCFGNGCGTVFKIDKMGHESVVYRFTGGADGGEPSSGLVLAPNGIKYGTTFIGGNLNCGGGAGCGLMYGIDKNGKQFVIGAFAGAPGGAYPGGSLALDVPNKAIYGTTLEGGDPTCNCGTVFKFDQFGLTTLHTFLGGTADGASPSAGVTLFNGTVFGTTPLGGGNAVGTVFSYVLASNDYQKMVDLTSAEANPYAAPNLDDSGNVYFPTSAGGALGAGAIVKLDTTGHITDLFDFDGTFDGGSALASMYVYVNGCPCFKTCMCLAGTCSIGGSAQQGPGSGTAWTFTVSQ
jgi:uncharacterized repeat protein (TIGR03803 family)